MDILRDRLERLYHTFDVSLLSPDPLEVVRRFDMPEDQEVAALIASSLAYGRAEKIVETVEQVFLLMGGAPYAFVLQFDPPKHADRFRSYVYRFTRGDAITDLLLMVQAALRQFGSLQALFLKGYNPKDPHIGSGLTQFVETLLDYSPSLSANGGVRYLLPSPRTGSACKRLNLFLRWMVRQDEIDLGLWRPVSPSRLIIPVDTHIARLSRLLGLTARRQADWKMAEEITTALRVMDPADPVKYDLSLCHLGMRVSRGLEDSDWR